MFWLVLFQFQPKLTFFFKNYEKHIIALGQFNKTIESLSLQNCIMKYDLKNGNCQTRLRVLIHISLRYSYMCNDYFLEDNVVYDFYSTSFWSKRIKLDSFFYRVLIWYFLKNGSIITRLAFSGQITFPMKIACSQMKYFCILSIKHILGTVAYDRPLNIAYHWIKYGRWLC